MTQRENAPLDRRLLSFLAPLTPGPAEIELVILRPSPLAPLRYFTSYFDFVKLLPPPSLSLRIYLGPIGARASPPAHAKHAAFFSLGEEKKGFVMPQSNKEMPRPRPSVPPSHPDRRPQW